jgi:hypothetical protein
MSPKAVIFRLAGAIVAALTGSAIIATSSMAMAADLATRIVA